MNKEQFAFRKGWLQVKQGDAPTCRKELMAALKLKTNAAFLQRVKGAIEPKVSEVEAINGVFVKYGINDVWGL